MREAKQPCVYILASRRHGTLYTGVTSNLLVRLHQHHTHAMKGFIAKHHITRLVWFEVHETMEEAITREKRIKKCNLIERENPQWVDLALGFGFEPQAFEDDEGSR